MTEETTTPSANDAPKSEAAEPEAKKRHPHNIKRDKVKAMKTAKEKGAGKAPSKSSKAPAKSKTTKAKGKGPSKGKKVSKPKKGSGTDYRNVPREDRKDSKTLALKAIGRSKAGMTVRELHDGVLAHLKLSGATELCKRLFREEFLTGEYDNTMGRSGRPPVRYTLTAKGRKEIGK